MRGLGRTTIEALGIGLMGLVLALVVNAARGSKGIDLTRNYFPKAPVVAPVPKVVKAAAATTTDVDPIDTPEDAQPKLVNGYKAISFEEVVALFEDPATEAGINIFVDARNDDAFQAGHIPGAIQCDHYQLEDYLDSLLEIIFDDAGNVIVEKIIVYCNGGACDDSGFMCTDLIEFDVPYDVLYLYEGGWKEWSKENQPVSTE